MYLGIDGCRAGWVIAQMDKGQQLNIRLIRHLEEIKSIPANVIYIDIPLHFAGQQYRACEVAAQRLLGPQKRASVFLTPCREAVYADTFSEANHINKRRVGKGVSIQAWNLFPKIKEAVAFRENSKMPLLEAHPELCFAYLNGRMPLRSKKATPQGIAERLQLIQSAGKEYKAIIEKAIAEARRREVKPDDFLDASVLAIRAASAQLQVVINEEAAITDGNIFF